MCTLIGTNGLSKIKMVRMVHNNLFYNKDLTFLKYKNNYGGKENMEGWEGQNFRIEIQNLTFDGCFEVNMIFKNILEVPALTPYQFL